MAAPGTPSSSGRTRRSPAASGHRLLALGLAVTILRAPLAAGDATTGLPRTGRCPDELASFDRLLAAFMDEHEVPGASLAVVRGSRLVAARGYGWADRERTEPVRPDSLFRIASISKPITAAAVMQLAERRKLDLDARILDVIGAAGAARAADEREGPGAAGAASAADGAEAAGAAAERDAAGAAGSRKAAGDTGGEKAGAETSAADGREAGGARDPRWDRITIRRLLQHTGGFDRDASFDPMFRSV
ncbi:MAG: beta-lactamase family protein, partial [Planctomycetes bacterium]|nr:beta-lactamase family protein [Planctomycetota bacterium]